MLGPSQAGTLAQSWVAMSRASASAEALGEGGSSRPQCCRCVVFILVQHRIMHAYHNRGQDFHVTKAGRVTGDNLEYLCIYVSIFSMQWKNLLWPG